MACVARKLEPVIASLVYPGSTAPPSTPAPTGVKPPGSASRSVHSRRLGGAIISSCVPTCARTERTQRIARREKAAADDVIAAAHVCAMAAGVGSLAESAPPRLLSGPGRTSSSSCVSRSESVETSRIERTSTTHGMYAAPSPRMAAAWQSCSSSEKSRGRNSSCTAYACVAPSGGSGTSAARSALCTSSQPISIAVPSTVTLAMGSPALGHGSSNDVGGAAGSASLAVSMTLTVIGCESSVVSPSCANGSAEPIERLTTMPDSSVPAPKSMGGIGCCETPAASHERAKASSKLTSGVFE